MNANSQSMIKMRLSCLACFLKLGLLGAMVSAAWGLNAQERAPAAPAAPQNPMVFERPEMAGISGFRAYWDKPVVLAEDGATRIVDHGNSGKGSASRTGPQTSRATSRAASMNAAPRR